jgi:molybdenum cofactor guanylyltransferase
MGGAKAAAPLNDRALISYPLRAVRQALGSAVIVAKAETPLPPVPGVEVWVEPAEPRHPLAGLVHALRSAQGRAVLVCACDLPLVTPEVVSALAQIDGGGAPAVIARSGTSMQPLLGCYRPEALPRLTPALNDPGVRLTDAVRSLGPAFHEVGDPEVLFNVNTPEDVLEAGALLARRPDQPNVKS